jgi:hypothetical protein
LFDLVGMASLTNEAARQEGQEERATISKDASHMDDDDSDDDAETLMDLIHNAS